MLELLNVTKKFPGTYKPALNQINLKLMPGDFCIIIGANGSGKSTLLKTISGEYTQNKGKILINNKITHSSNRSKKMSEIVQDVNQGTIPEMTLLENLALSYLGHLKLNFYSRFKQKALAQLKSLSLGLEQHIDKPLKNLSGGQRQVIATLMSFNNKPDILLIDEHTSALDPKMQKTLMQYTSKNIQDNNITSLMITHNINDAIYYGNRLIMLNQGEIVLNYSEEEKRQLTAPKLLELFHYFEDQNLKGETN